MLSFENKKRSEVSLIGEYVRPCTSNQNKLNLEYICTFNEKFPDCQMKIFFGQYICFFK